MASKVEYNIVVEPKTTHVSAIDALPSVGDYPIGTVIESEDGERFRLDLVQPRTQWVPVEAVVPEKVDYTKMKMRELLAASRNGDEDADAELERRFEQGPQSSTPPPAPGVMAPAPVAVE